MTIVADVECDEVDDDDDMLAAMTASTSLAAFAAPVDLLVCN